MGPYRPRREPMVAWQLSCELGVCDGSTRMAVVLWVLLFWMASALLTAQSISAYWTEPRRWLVVQAKPSP